MAKRTEVRGGNRRRVQVRRAPRVSFTAEKRQIFLDHLAACCNVTRAAEAAGIGVSTVYDARRRDPVFAEQWADAIEAGYATLEALLIERAAVGGSYKPGETPVPGPETVDTWLAMDLLRLSRMKKAPRNFGGAPPRREIEKAVNDSILAKLDVFDRRMKAKRAKARKKKAVLRDDEAGRPVPRKGPRTSGGDPHLLISTGPSGSPRARSPQDERVQ